MEYFQERCLLAPCNWEANDINDIILNKFPGDIHNLWAVDKAVDPDSQLPMGSPYPTKVLHSTSLSGFPLAHLRLKIGCPIIVLCNLHSNDGVCNGSRGIVTWIFTRVVEILLHSGDTCLILHIKLICSDAQLPFHLHHRQFPLALAFAITIN